MSNNAAPAEIKETLDAKVSEEDGRKTLNQYTFIKQLGSGSFGTVHLALDNEKKIKVAIKECSKSKLKKQKQQAAGNFGGRGRGRGAGPGRRVTVMRPAVETNSSPLDLVRGEVAILKKLHHRNVVKLFEVLDDPNQDSLFMVFELCERGTVMDISMTKSTEPLPIPKARDFFQQLVLGIEYLHEHDIAHRDIKPDNMLLSADGVVKIVDFGVSEFFSKGNDKMKNTAGSPAFYPPENVGLTKGDVSGVSADIWAMGVTLYCMVFGKLPFVGKTIILLYDAIREQPVEYPEGADPKLVDLLSRLLEKDPLKRIEMGELRDHPWITDNGKSRMITFEENCVVNEINITNHDLSSAIKSGKTVVKKVAKLAQIGKKLSIRNPDPKDPDF